MPNDNHEILAIHQEWMDAERRNDVQSILDLCSGEIQFFPPDGPIIQGKEAIREFLLSGSDSLDQIEYILGQKHLRLAIERLGKQKWTHSNPLISNIHVEISGSLAFKTAHFLTHLRSGNQEVTAIRGNHLWVLRQESNRWCVLIVSWSIW